MVECAKDNKRRVETRVEALGALQRVCEFYSDDSEAMKAQTMVRDSQYVVEQLWEAVRVCVVDQDLEVRHAAVEMLRFVTDVSQQCSVPSLNWFTL